MTAIDHGIFTPWQPTHQDLRPDHPFRIKGKLFQIHPHVNWVRNEKGQDWYDIMLAIPKGRWGILCCPDTGRVESQSNDPQTLFPGDRRFIESDADVPDGTIWDGSKLITPPKAPPVDTNLQKELEFKVEEYGIYSAWHKGDRIAQIAVGPDLKTGKPCSQWMQTDPAYQRRGVISALVKFIELVISEPLTISSTRTLQGAQWRDKFDAAKPPLPPDPPA